MLLTIIALTIMVIILAIGFLYIISMIELKKDLRKLEEIRIAIEALRIQYR